MGGGTETSTLELINQFDDSVEITVCYFYNKHDLLDKFKKANCKLIYLNLPGSYSFPTGIRELYKLVRNEKYDLMVTSLYRASMISRFVSLITKVPLVDTMVNDSYGIGKRKEFKGAHIIKFWMVYLLDRVTSFVPKLWISNSKFLSLQLGRQLAIDSRKIEVIYRGRDITKIIEWLPPENILPFHIVSIGRLFVQKAQDDLIKSFAMFHKKYPESTLTIYGEGPQRNYLEKLINELQLQNIVQLPGRVQEAWRQLYKAHCFVLPSSYEGFSGALVEAVVSGIPIVASDIPMNLEAVSDNINGQIYPVGNIEQLFNKLCSTYENYKGAIEQGKNARNMGLIQYDLKLISRNYQNLLMQFQNSNKI